MNLKGGWIPALLSPMLDLSAPTMGDGSRMTRACVDERAQPQPASMNVITLFLQMTVCGGGLLVLLFAAQAVMRVCTGCAWGTRYVSTMMTSAGRNALTRMLPWRRAVYVFYLGTTASWTSSRASLSFSADRTVLPAEVRAPLLLDSQAEDLEVGRTRTITLIPERLFVLGGHPLAMDPGKRAIGIGDAA
jgi:hypothetical protein